jgi:ABC-type transporter Mla subunit MlaD
MRSDLFKLGLFTIAGILAVIGVAFVFEIRSSPSEVYHTYFDESVTGLDVGAPVNFRGVRIGRVGEVGFAPDRRHIDVSLAIDRAHARRLDLATIAPQLRTQLTIQGITGVKLIDIEFVGPSTGPPPQLAFKPARRYIASRPSMMKGLEANLENLEQGLPQLIDRANATMKDIQLVVRDLHRAQLPERVGTTVDRAGEVVGELHGLVQRFDRSRIPERLSASLDKVDQATNRMNQILDGVGGERGLVASAKRATDSIGELGRSTVGSTRELERTIRDLDDAARSVRQFFDALNREPDMLVKGRARSRKP